MMQTLTNACVGSLSSFCLYNTNIPTCFTTCTHPALFVTHLHTLTPPHTHTCSPPHTYTSTHTCTPLHTHTCHLSHSHIHTSIHHTCTPHTHAHLYIPSTRNSLGECHPCVYCCQSQWVHHTDVWGPRLSSTLYHLDKGVRHSGGGHRIYQQGYRSAVVVCVCVCVCVCACVCACVHVHCTQSPDCTHVLRNLQIACSISGFWERNTISRLHKFSDCTEHNLCCLLFSLQRMLVSMWSGSNWYFIVLGTGTLEPTTALPATEPGRPAGQLP